MSSIDKRERFCERYVTDKEGQSFTLKGREWVREKLWLPLDGYKWWPNDFKKLCVECKDKAGTLTASHKDHDCTNAIY